MNVNDSGAGSGAPFGKDGQQKRQVPDLQGINNPGAGRGWDRAAAAEYLSAVVGEVIARGGRTGTESKFLRAVAAAAEIEPNMRPEAMAGLVRLMAVRAVSRTGAKGVLTEFAHILQCMLLVIVQDTPWMDVLRGLELTESDRRAARFGQKLTSRSELTGRRVDADGGEGAGQ